MELVKSQQYEELVRQLLKHHYDPCYTKNRKQYFENSDPRQVLSFNLDSLDAQYLHAKAVPTFNNLVSYWDQKITTSVAC